MSYSGELEHRQMDAALRRGIYGRDPQGTWSRGVHGAAAKAARRRKAKIHVPPRFGDQRA